MSDNEVLIKVDGVSKRFCRSLKRSLWYGVGDIAQELNPFGGGTTKNGSNSEFELRQDEFWAVKDVSFEVRRGECLGLIGGNGAGKTTLLKMLNGLIKPDCGRIEMHGRVGALIALGAGFNPILTGRENIYVNGSILGLNQREIDKKLEEIIDFADIADFIESPVQSYSSGMQVRLGFAVATALDTDILILDEVLAVGDEAFQVKCRNRIGKLSGKCAVIFVSHSLGDVARTCNRFLVLRQGQSVYCGNDQAKAVNEYRHETETLPLLAVSDGATIQDFSLTQVDGRKTKVRFNVIFRHDVDACAINVALADMSGKLIAMRSSVEDNVVFRSDTGTTAIRFVVFHDFLLAGKYFLQIALVEPRGPMVYARLFNKAKIDVDRVGVGYTEIAPRVDWFY